MNFYQIWSDDVAHDMWRHGKWRVPLLTELEITMRSELNARDQGPLGRSKKLADVIHNVIHIRGFSYWGHIDMRGQLKAAAFAPRSASKLEARAKS